MNILCLILVIFIQQSEQRDMYHPIPKLGPNGELPAGYRRQLVDSEETNAEFWTSNAQETVKRHVSQVPNLKKAKNVMLFVGDGMSVPTCTASRIYMGQLNNRSGEESQLEFDKFPYSGFSKTYCVDKQVADSACSATAYLCGVKANHGTIGVTAKVKYNECTAGQNPQYHVDSLAVWAQKAGKATGVVTTARVTHASPAGTYAHVANREYECDADLIEFGQNSSTCQDIAKQLILNSTGTQFKVILGGGRTKFLPNSVRDEDGYVGERLDGLNLIETWKKSKTRGQYVTNLSQLKSVNYKQTDYLLGLFNGSDLPFHLDANASKDPSLADLTEAAIKMLQKDPNGFFVFIEGGRIDHAHHETKARIALDETVELSKAIGRALELTNKEETLIVVTSDHAHTMSISGYSLRGVDILGLNSENSTIDGLPYSTLSYANGPGYTAEKNGKRLNLSTQNLSDKNYEYPSLVPLTSETHGGDDVGVFATGPWAHLFTGVIEEHVIPHLVGYAACIGNGVTMCSKK